jgi:hypothetical protein
MINVKRQAKSEGGSTIQAHALRRNFCFMLFHRALYKVDPAVRE